MKYIVLSLIIGLTAIPAMAQTVGQPTVPLSGGQCTGGNCKGAPNAPTNPDYVAPSQITILPLDAATGSGSAAVTILTGNHAAKGGWFTTTAAYCYSLTGVSLAVNDRASGTNCGFTAGAVQSLPAMTSAQAVSVYCLSSCTMTGAGSQ